MSGAPDDLPHKLRKFDWYRTAMLINEDRASTADGWGKLPLHVALGNRQVTPIAIIRDLVLAYPAGVKKQDHQGKLPLHYAAEFNSCDIEVFQLLLDEYPEGISIKNKWGQLPLHVACWRNAPDDVIELLYTKSPPGAAEMIDTLAMLPPAQHTLSKTLAKLTAAA